MNHLLSPAEPARVIKTIFRSDVSPTMTISLVEYADGRLGVLANGAAAAGGPWSIYELEECIDVFRHCCRSGVDGRKHAH